MANMQQLETYQKKEQNTESLDQLEMEIDDSKWIMEVLFKRLYQNPIKSICREIISNGVDAQKRAKVTRPLEITRPTQEDLLVKIKDFGVGMSEEDIKNIYTKIGKTTKTLHDDEIGGFGIGSKSPFAYGDFQIESVKDGEKVIAWVYQDSHGSFVMRMTKEKTDENSGTTIQIPVKPEDYEKWRASLDFYQNMWGGGEVNHKRVAKGFKNEFGKAVLRGIRDQIDWIQDIRCWVKERKEDNWVDEIYTWVYTWRGVPYPPKDLWAPPKDVYVSGHVIEVVLDPNKVIPSPSRETLKWLSPRSEEQKENMEMCMRKQALAPWMFEGVKDAQSYTLVASITQNLKLKDLDRSPRGCFPGVKVELKGIDGDEIVRLFEREARWRSRERKFVEVYAGRKSPEELMQYVANQSIYTSVKWTDSLLLLELPREQESFIARDQKHKARTALVCSPESKIREQLMNGVTIEAWMECGGEKIKTPYSIYAEFGKENQHILKEAATKKKVKWKTNSYRMLDTTNKRAQFICFWHERATDYGTSLKNLANRTFSKKELDLSRPVFLLPESRASITISQLGALAMLVLFPEETSAQVIYCESETKAAALKERLKKKCHVVDMAKYRSGVKFEDLFLFYTKNEKRAFLRKVDTYMKKYHLDQMVDKAKLPSDLQERVKMLMMVFFSSFPNLIHFRRQEERLYRFTPCDNYYGILGSKASTSLSSSKEDFFIRFYAVCKSNFGRDWVYRAWACESDALRKFLGWKSILSLAKRTKGKFGND